MSPIDCIEQATVDEYMGRITRAEAIARIRAVVNVTAAGAADLLDHPESARSRYEQISGGAS